MAENPKCSTVASAMQKSNLSYADIALKIGKTEKHVSDICTHKVDPTKEEFDALATALGITSTSPSSQHHVTK